MNKLPTIRAFTLLEMLVSLAIFGVIMSVVLFNNGDFNNTIFLGNTAFDIGLQLRQAQQYGVSSRGYAGDFKVGYGVLFSGTTASVAGTSYKTFSDTNANKRYDPTTDTDLTLTTLPAAYSIRKYCAYRSDNSSACSDSAVPISGLAISFLRPETDATISTYVGTPLTFSETGFASAEIILQSRSGATSTIYVQTTGQISIRK